MRHCVAFPAGNLHHPCALPCWLEECDAAVAQALAWHGPGATTLVAVWLDQRGRGFLAHAGDCRAYLWRPGEGLRPLTRDHSYRELGKNPPPGISPNNPARMIGLGARHQVELQRLQLAAGDTILLTSDGLHGVLDDPNQTRTLERNLIRTSGNGLRRNETNESLAILSRHLASLARELGSSDDIAALLLNWAG